MEQQQKTALLSAFDKDGLERFARSLTELGWKILASTGTARYLNELGIEARDVAEIVGEPILGHRVVTLSREIHAALLATDSAADTAELKRLGVPRIGLVYVNMYPLQAEIAKPSHTMESVIEKTDIGGPTMLRSAAKGRRLVVCRPIEFEPVLSLLRGAPLGSGVTEQQFISWLVSVAEREVSSYCATSCEFHERFAGRAFAATAGPSD